MQQGDPAQPPSIEPPVPASNNSGKIDATLPISGGAKGQASLAAPALIAYDGPLQVEASRSVAASPPTAFAAQPWNLIERVGKLRDGILIAASTLYVLGYLVWSYNAFRREIGPLPGLDAQYFVAGLGPGVSLLVAWLYVSQWLPQIRLFFEKRPRLSFAMTVIAVGTALAEFWLRETASAELAEQLKPLLVLPAFTIMMVFNLMPSKSRSQLRFYRIGELLQLLLVICAAIGLYALLLYPNIPQELGGAKPRCAYIDADKDKLSPQLLGEMFPGAAAQPESKVVRSERLEVLYSSKDSVVVRLDPASQPENRKTFEVLARIACKQLPTSHFEVRPEIGPCRVGMPNRSFARNSNQNHIRDKERISGGTKRVRLATLEYQWSLAFERYARTVYFYSRRFLGSGRVRADAGRGQVTGAIPASHSKEAACPGWERALVSEPK